MRTKPAREASLIRRRLALTFLEEFVHTQGDFNEDRRFSDFHHLAKE